MHWRNKLSFPHIEKRGKLGTKPRHDVWTREPIGKLPPRSALRPTEATRSPGVRVPARPSREAPRTAGRGGRCRERQQAQSEAWCGQCCTVSEAARFLRPKLKFQKGDQLYPLTQKHN